MTEFINSLKRLYDTKKISKEKIDMFLEEKKITLEEHLYILGKEGS